MRRWELRRMRIVAIVLPWRTLRRIRMLTEPPYLVEVPDRWDQGYEKFAYEVRLNMGLPDWTPAAAAVRQDGQAE